MSFRKCERTLKWEASAKLPAEASVPKDWRISAFTVPKCRREIGRGSQCSN